MIKNLIPFICLFFLSSCFVVYTPGDQHKLFNVPDLENYEQAGMSLVIIKSTNLRPGWFDAKSPVISFIRENNLDEKEYAFETMASKKPGYKVYQIYPGTYNLIYKKYVKYRNGYQAKPQHHFSIKKGEVLYIGDVGIDYLLRKISVKSNLIAAKQYLDNSAYPELSAKLRMRIISH